MAIAYENKATTFKVMHQATIPIFSSIFSAGQVENTGDASIVRYPVPSAIFSIIAKTLYERGLMYLVRSGKGDRDKAHEDLDKALGIFQKVGA
ncbi:MAG TPA: hypothetical protein VEG43_05485, partial [Dehalococcoidia bacterium]|nr:hypothetical protein [Dehalococcoidia bacterium]